MAFGRFSARLWPGPLRQGLGRGGKVVPRCPRVGGAQRGIVERVVETRQRLWREFRERQRTLCPPGGDRRLRRRLPIRVDAASVTRNVKNLRGHSISCACLLDDVADPK
ncbi:hypothetical protein SAMN04488026_103525 [Aliiruegeria lutimaris]|uniref:Uncharacterized protein n=1 Tax=Aliiruegeria lutimaris TaxID=571298 RepID=A0A1G9AE94_9RHOB|nr:hypothetical protein SAMN04488026_103525 [Aliiruegeria lutimaris]